MVDDSQPKAELLIRPFAEGIRNNKRVIIGDNSRDHLLLLTKQEFNELQRLGDGYLTVADLMFNHWGRQDAISFKASLDLWAKLYKHNFVEPSSIHLRHKLDTLFKEPRGPQVSALDRLWQSCKRYLQLRLRPFRQLHPSSGISGKLATACTHPATLGAMTAVILTAATGMIVTVFNNKFDMAIDTLLTQPKPLLIAGSIAMLAVAISLLRWLQAWILSTISHDDIDLDIQLSGLLVPHFTIRNDNASFLTTRGECMRYHAFGLLTPWLSAGMVWVVTAAQPNATGLFFMLNFIAIGLAGALPWQRTTLVKFLEAYFVRQHIDLIAKLHLKNFIRAIAAPFLKFQRQLRFYRLHRIKSSAAISKFLQDIPLFKQLPADVIIQLTKYLRLAEYQTNQTIIHQNDTSDYTFVMALGTTDVLATDNDGTQKLLDTLHPGETFGEMALVSESPRQYSVIARSRARVLILTKAAFARIFPTDSEHRQHIIQQVSRGNLLLNSPALSYLRRRQIQQFLRKAEVIQFPADTIIMTEGSRSNAVYVIESGSAHVLHGGANGEIVARLERGDLFGMISLLRNAPRTTTVFASSDVSCLKLHKQDFLDLCLQSPLAGALVTALDDQQLLELQNSLHEAG